MRLDSQAIFSDAQAITKTDVSTNVVKLASTEHGLTEIAFGKEIPLLIQVVEDFNNATSVKVGVQTSATEDFSSVTTLVEATLALADLKAGKKFPIKSVPAGNKGFMRLYYTVTGTAPTTGKITAGVVDAIDNSYQDIA
jgi:hypothetical protein